MDDPNMTMEEYIKLEKEKARRRGRVFNWQTATYGKIRVDDDLCDLRSVEAEFPAIVINDAFAPQDTLQCKSQVFNFRGLPDLMADGLSARMLMEHRDAQGADSSRQIPDKGDLRDYWIGISSARDFLGTSPFYTAIRDLILRLCHQLIACSIAGRSQAPEKVTVTDLFYLRGIDVGSVNVPYLLARYLRLFATRRKSGAHISGGQFVARLAEHFGLLTVEILGGLIAWVSMRPKRQPDAAASAPTVAEDTPAADEGDQAVPAPVQAPQQPTPPPLSEIHRIKPDSKFSTIVHKYVTEPSRIFTLNARMGKRDDFEYGEAEEKSSLKTSL
ncbi:hypothetical protein Tco_1051489, partial [Tanacetum coccineum]